MRREGGIDDLMESNLKLSKIIIEYDVRYKSHFNFGMNYSRLRRLRASLSGLNAQKDDG